MTRQEVTGVRSLDFSKWVRSSLPDSSTGFSASDLDFILWNWKTKRFMFLEIKTRRSFCRKGQQTMFSLLNLWMNECMDNNLMQEWHYLGFHLIQFENTNFEDGKCYFNFREITESDLITTLSLTDESVNILQSYKKKRVA